MTLRDELAKMFAAEIGPPVGNPEWLAKHGERLLERNQKTAERWADLSAKVFREWLGSEEVTENAVRAMLTEEAEFSPGQRILYGLQPLRLAKAALASLTEASE